MYAHTHIILFKHCVISAETTDIGIYSTLLLSGATFNLIISLCACELKMHFDVFQVVSKNKSQYIDCHLIKTNMVETSQMISHLI